MFNFRTTVVLGLVLAFFESGARAAVPIEFVFGGVFTQTTNTVHQVGAPFTSTVVFDSAATDTNPSTEIGNYPYIRWTAPGRTNTPIVFENVPATVGSIQIIRITGGHAWQVDYQGASQFRWTLIVEFPVGTFPTDALPQSLDFSQATAARFEAFDGQFLMDLRGTVTSFAIPEPTFTAALGLYPLVAPRSRQTRARAIRVENTGR